MVAVEAGRASHVNPSEVAKEQEPPRYFLPEGELHGINRFSNFDKRGVWQGILYNVTLREAVIKNGQGTVVPVETQISMKLYEEILGGAYAPPEGIIFQQPSTAP